MDRGTLIDDLFAAVEKAEKAASQLPHASHTEEEAVLAGAGGSAGPHRSRDSETK